jgi:hypothetical protein
MISLSLIKKKKKRKKVESNSQLFIDRVINSVSMINILYLTIHLFNSSLFLFLYTNAMHVSISHSTNEKIDKMRMSLFIAIHLWVEKSYLISFYFNMKRTSIKKNERKEIDYFDLDLLI